MPAGPDAYTEHPAPRAIRARSRRAHRETQGVTTTVAVKIRLKRMGKIRAPFYRVVVMDSRTKRDGRAIEEIGKYHPTEEPSLIQIDSERAQYWLGNGAQPTEAVAALLKITGDWQKYKGEPGTEGTLKVKAAQDPEEGPLRGRPRRRRQGHLRRRLGRHHPEEARRQEGRGGPPPRPPAAEAAPGRRGRPASPRTPTRVPPPPRASTASRRGRDRGPRGRGRRRREGLTVLEEALEHLVTGIVDHKDEVQVRRKELRRGEVLEVRVHPDDLGRVIGRSGRTASALRTVMGALAGGRQVRIDIVDTDRVR